MFAWAVQIAVRSEGKWIYVTDQENENIQVFNADGTAGNPTIGLANPQRPHGFSMVALTSSVVSKVYVRP
jgi:hypothetical protein